MNKVQYQQQLQSHTWQLTRERIVDQSFGICEYCHQPDDFLQVHHEKYIGKHPSDTPDEHLKAVCRKCHNLKHWTDRLAAYSQRKRELFASGIFVSHEMNEQLIKSFEV